MPSLTPRQVLLFGVVLACGFVIALFPVFPTEIRVQEGEIASRDIRSPRSVTFESELLTEQERQKAADAVPAVLEFDASIQPAQLDRLQGAAATITQVRRNDSLDDAAKRARLLSFDTLSGLSRGSVDTILALSDEGWQRVTDEAESVLTSTLSQEIGPDGVEAAQEGLVEQVGPLPAAEVALVADLVRPLIVPSLVLNEEATQSAQEAARQSVGPVLQSVAQNQVIVEDGQPIDATTLEMLEEVGLLDSSLQWDNLAAVAVIAGLAAAALALYLWHFPVVTASSTRNLLLLALVVVVPVFLAKVHFSLVLPDDDRRFLAYFLPLAASVMLVATLLGTRLALMIALVQAVLMAFAVVYLPDLSLVTTIEPLDVGRVLLVYGFAAVAGVYAVHRAERLNQYAVSGLVAGGAALAALFTFWLLDPEREAFDAVWMTTAAAVSGIGSGLLTAGLFVGVGAWLGVTTRVQLMELSQLNAPLLRRLQDEAPGTFHHSIIVGNLGERAADLVGADSLLVRVGCYYHDIGKIEQPGYYIENQLGGDNPHDGMDPKESARIIARHVRAGEELARRHGLPHRVQAFIPEHHGSRLIAYFYRVAKQKDSNADPELFRYPGPKPRSRETAIVMLADSTEALVRASEDRSPERIDELVEEVVSERLAEGELDESDLTLRDIRTIAESFKRTLRAVYHPRIEYPEPTLEERHVFTRFRPGRRSAAPPLPEAPVPPRRRSPT